MGASADLLERFPHRLGGHCGSGALRALLEHEVLDLGAGPLSEGAVFGLAGGLGFLFAELPDARPPVYLVGRTGRLEEDLATNLGAGLDLLETDDPARGWADLRDELDAGRPAMVWADIGHLEYLRVRMHNTRHDVVVVGYDEAAGVAFVADNDRDELQRCSLASLARARASDAFPGPNRHRVFRYRWPVALPAPREAVTAGLRRAVANMREAVSFLPGAEHGAGLPGVATFAASYPTWAGWDDELLDQALSGLRVFVVKAGTGGAMFRSLHAEFLHDAAALLGDAALDRAAEGYDALAEAWVGLAGCAREHDHGAGLPLVDEVARREAEGVAAMERWLAGSS
ncbi:BtrH N-terminal domain-containing protein [Conexibacter sp. SYSU D00693]|uniref:BtrH N-terminal domain-containing protein n=1 Tax=Conexibacter sp. SYSU D00693 TaxID=2812560 RepID=UPI00196AD042|nr:BtrH N-terminal domain-containing protein [Conexibacter sp. SYSU D00693]